MCLRTSDNNNMASTGDHSVPKDQSSSADTPTKTSNVKPDQSTVDPDLDDLLDSALADFDKPSEGSKVTAPPAVAATAIEASTNSGDGSSSTASHEAGAEGVTDKGDKSSNPKPSMNPEDGLPDDLNYDFMSDAMTKQFEDTFSALMKEQFSNLAGSAEQAAATNNPAAFAETVEQALSGLNLNAESLQGDPNQQELWEQLAETLGAGDLSGSDATAGGLGGFPGMPGGMEGAEDGLGAVSGMFQNMVKQLLSKELLYQPLKEVSEKYTDYLEKHQHDLEGETLTKYRAQHEVIDKVVEHLDQESSTHSLEEKNARFEVLLDLLQRMHELGNPPTEVVGEGNMMVPNFAELGNLGNLGQLPNLGSLGNFASGQDPSQCSVM